MRLIFTMTAGRTGTGYLAELMRRNLPGAMVFHEQLDWRAFGVRTPEVSQLVRFNHVGFDPVVASFWRRKLEGILAAGVSTYAETSHVLMKAGLVEALLELSGEHEIHLIAQRRRLVPTMLSYRERGDFANLGNRYLWYLDPSYPRNVVQPAPFLQLGLPGTRLWYLMEIRARAAWYAGRVAERDNVFVHHTELERVTQPEGALALMEALGGDPAELELPKKVNAGAGAAMHSPAVRQQVEELVAQVSEVDPDELVAPLLRQGRDLFGCAAEPEAALV